MVLTPRVRKLALTLHVTASVGWFGGILAFLGVAVAGVVSDDIELVRSADLVMEVIGWWVLVPLSAASLVSGLVQSFGTRWGLWRHYWVIIKLIINVIASGVLLLYTSTLSHYADLASDRTATDLNDLRSTSAVVHATAALVLLVIATVLSIYKPAGMTRYGQRKQRGTTPA